jgi:hypothetical protein
MRQRDVTTSDEASSPRKVISDMVGLLPKAEAAALLKTLASELESEPSLHVARDKRPFIALAVMALVVAALIAAIVQMPPRPGIVASQAAKAPDNPELSQLLATPSQQEQASPSPAPPLPRESAAVFESRR